MTAKERAVEYAAAALNGVGRPYAPMYQRRIAICWLAGFNLDGRPRNIDTNYDAPLRCAYADGLRAERREGGFTLIEIVIAVLLIGILTTIAVPKFQAHKRQAHVASVISQLRHLQQAQEHHYLEADRYADAIGSLPDLQVASKIPVVIVAGTQMGWSATARYRETTVVCAIFYGTAPIPPPATPADDGEPVCTW